MTKFELGIALAALVAVPAACLAQSAHPGEGAFRALYKELVETNTTISSGSGTLASARMAAHL